MKHRGQCIFVDNCGCILVVNMFNMRATRIPSAAARLCLCGWIVKHKNEPLNDEGEMTSDDGWSIQFQIRQWGHTMEGVNGMMRNTYSQYSVTGSTPCSSSRVKVRLELTAASPLAYMDDSVTVALVPAMTALTLVTSSRTLVTHRSVFQSCPQLDHGNS